MAWDVPDQVTPSSHPSPEPPGLISRSLNPDYVSVHPEHRALIDQVLSSPGVAGVARDIAMAQRDCGLMEDIVAQELFRRVVNPFDATSCPSAASIGHCGSRAHSEIGSCLLESASQVAVPRSSLSPVVTVIPNDSAHRPNAAPQCQAMEGPGLSAGNQLGTLAKIQHPSADFRLTIQGPPWPGTVMRRWVDVQNH